ncbi:MAG: SAM-dependent chlorinase/fluorinase [Bacteroidales bacterium]|jgi:S-adenosylmethionine hydrolase|nr:SAM-dependent chlorinase/fluorinase [Bacteroidales bacterium]
MAADRNHIATITSDWGTADHYLATVKGALLSLCPQARLIDISHSVVPFDTFQAAFILKNSYLYYPKNSWHIIAVETKPSLKADQLIVQYNDHYFISCDNGVFSLIFEGNPAQEIYRIKKMPFCESSPFPTRDIYIPILAAIFNGKSISDIADPVDSFVEKRMFQPVVQENKIIGRSVYFDNYENIYTNIRRADVERKMTAKPFILTIGNYSYEIKKVVSAFSEVGEGDFALLFVNDYLMIAINHGNAAGLLIDKKNKWVQIQLEF